MTPIELLYTLEDIDEAFIADGAPMAKKTAFPVVARRWIAVAACLLLSAGIGFGAWQWQEAVPTPENSEEESMATTTTEGTTATTTQKPTESTNQPTTGTTNWEGVGGGYGGSYVYVNRRKHYVVNFFSEYIYKTYTDAERQAVTGKISAEYNGIPYAYTGDSLQRWIIELNIPSKKIEELNEISKEFYKDALQYDEYVYTDEEINDMYTLTIEQYNQKHKAPTAAIIGAVLYPFDWFVDNPVEIWQQHDFTIEQIQEVLENGKKASFPEQYIHTFAEKLEEYKKAVTE